MNKLVSVAEISITDLVKQFESMGIPLNVQTDENDVFFDKEPSASPAASEDAWTLTRVGYATALNVRMPFSSTPKSRYRPLVLHGGKNCVWLSSSL